MTRRRRFNTVSGRLLILGAFPSLLAVGSLVTLSAVDSWRDRREAAETHMRAEARAVATEFASRAAQWAFAARASAEAQHAGLFGRREATLRYLRDILEPEKSQIEGTWVVYEPNADGNDRSALEAALLPAGSMDDSGRFLPYYFVEDHATGRIGLKPNAGMESGEWYAGVQAVFESTRIPRPLITEPYLYEGVQMVTYAHPLVFDGRFLGVAGVDRSLATLSSIVDGLARELGADVFVLSRKGHFVAASVKTGVAGERLALAGTDAAETPLASIATRWLGAGSGEVFEARDPMLDEACFYAVAKAGMTDWTVVLRQTDRVALADARSSLWRNAALGVLAVAAIAVLMYLAARRIATRMRVAVDSAERIASGDLSVRVAGAGGGDETAQLLGAMGAMARNLNALLSAVKSATITLGSTATEMAASAKAQQASASSFGSASNQIAVAVTEISATGSDLVRTMDGVSTAARETAGLATAGRRGLQGMESVMRDLDRATGSIGDKLAAINERSQKITTVITTISKVADQTNILSINAAIEAEKAGEYGSGFLVIAREIRRLADQTAAATLDIEQMVQQMQSAVSAGVMEMDRFADQVRRGVDEVATAATRLGEIIDRVNRSTESFHQVSDGMQAQSAGARQIHEAMGHLTGNATQAMESIEQFGRAADDLQGAIASLREAVAKFTLGEEQ
jgi:methyl-accepting chemotaxis protein